MNSKIKQTLLLTIGLAAFTTAMSQQATNASFKNALDESNKGLRALKNKQDEQELKKMSGKATPLFQQATSEMTAATVKQLLQDAAATEQYMKKREQQFPVKKFQFDIPSDLQAAPAPVSDPVQASRSKEDVVYKPYFDRLQQREQQLKDLAKKHDRYQEIHDKEGQAGLEKRAAMEADKNVLVQEMGGTEKLKNMSEAERRAAAEQMKAKLQQDPSMLTGGTQDPGMKAMQQKLISDPEYAKRFSKMNEAEKQAEMKKYMTVKPATGTPQTEKPKAGNEDVLKSIEVNELLARSQKEMQEVTATYSRMLTRVNNTIEEMRSQLRQWGSQTEKGIPVVELGEYGHDKDPEQMQAMEITMKHGWYFISVQELKMRAICWQQLKNGTRAAMAEFNNYVATYAFGKGNDSQLFNGTYNDPKMIEAIGGWYGAMEELAKTSRSITSDAKSAQNSFEKR